MRLVPYDRAAAVRYAHEWAYGRNPRFYDYELIGGDCTNFASQCLYAGSRIMDYTPTYGWETRIDAQPLQSAYDTSINYTVSSYHCSIHEKGVCNMIGLNDLEQLKRDSAAYADAESLTDINTVTITGSTPDERLESLLGQVKNPYCYRVGNTAVKISFVNSSETLEEKLKRYFISLKSR